jgi:hypothetical protein
MDHGSLVYFLLAFLNLLSKEFKRLSYIILMVNPRIKRLTSMDLDAKYAEYKAAHPMIHIKPDRFKKVAFLGGCSDYPVSWISDMTRTEKGLVSKILKETGVRTASEIEHVRRLSVGNKLERMFNGALLDATREGLQGGATHEDIARRVGIAPDVVGRVQQD